MKVIEQYVFEPGDLFTGTGEGGYFIPNSDKMLIGHLRFAYVKEVGINSVWLQGDGETYNFTPEQLTEHFKVGNLVYIGNALKGNK